MTPDDLTRWEQLCNAASEGPWYMDVAIANDGHVVMSSPLGHRIAHCYHTEVNRNDAADAEFCAAAREAMPQLIAEVRRLAALVGQRDELASDLADVLLRIEKLEGRE